jgi:hypothetical protein
MPIMRRWIPFAALLLAETPLAHAQTVPKLRITAFGEYIAHRTPEIPAKALTTNTLSPVDRVEDVQFVSRTNQIDAKLCRRFGIRFEAPNLDADGRKERLRGYVADRDQRPGARRGRLRVRPSLGSRSWHLDVHGAVWKHRAGRTAI